MSAAGKRHLAMIHTLPCVVCRNCYGSDSRCDEAHHLESVRGPHSAFATIPLCKSCHDDLHARHRRAFYRAHKLDDIKLLAWTNELVAVKKAA